MLNTAAERRRATPEQFPAPISREQRELIQATVRGVVLTMLGISPAQQWLESRGEASR